VHTATIQSMTMTTVLNSDTDLTLKFH